MTDVAEVARNYFRALTDGDVDAAVKLVADDADFRSPMGSIHGKDQIRGFLGAFEAAFPSAEYNIETVFENGNLVAVEGVYEGTHTGPLMTPTGASIEATGRTATAPFVTILAVTNGLITSHRPYWDVAGFMAQLVD